MAKLEDVIRILRSAAFCPFSRHRRQRACGRPCISLIRVLASGGESAAADLVAKVGSHAETARELANRLCKVR